MRMNTMEKNVNMSIVEGDSFFAHELAVNYNPTQFILDFKNITPRNDPRGKDSPVLVLKHDVIMVTPYHAVLIHKLLGDMLERFEKDFGKIEKPKAVKSFEKKKKKRSKDSAATAAPTVPNYFG